MKPKNKPKNGDRALVVWFGGQAAPVVAMWGDGRWNHTGTCQSSPDKVFPVNDLIVAHDAYGVLVDCFWSLERLLGDLGNPHAIAEGRRVYDRAVQQLGLGLDK